ncbi:MAG: dihydroxyacetone kinase subunit DhaK [[Clostridium] innocuum]
MKKMIDQKETLVQDMLAGYVQAFGHRVRLLHSNILLRKNEKEQNKTAVIIGNGSGHEPAMIDLVGKGLFDADVCGRIFTAPSPLEMLEAVKELTKHGRKNVLILVSSHAGDILNAKMACMLAEAEGIHVEMVVLWDDIASAPKGKEKERRGTAGLFFPYKIVCSAAEDGKSLPELIALAEKARDETRTLSVAISSGTHPETGLPTFTLKEDEIEVGMGVHGEAGSGRRKLTSAKELSNYMLEQLLADKPFVPGDEVAVLVNNAGSLTRMELMIIYRDVAEYLSEKGISIIRSWVGTYVTTQEMAGFSIALCRMDEELLRYYDYPADSPLFEGR